MHSKATMFRLSKVTHKTLAKTFLVFVIFYSLYALRSWYGYSILDPKSNVGEWFLILTKTPVWLILAYVLLKWWYPKNWLEKSGFKTFNHKTLMWLVVATILPLIYFFLQNKLFFGGFNYKPNWTFSLVFFEIRNSIVEESLFRGFLQPFLNDKFGFWKSVVVQGFLFSAIHWCWWVFAGEFSFEGALYIWVLGIFWGFIKQKSGSIFPSLFSHTIHNLVLAMII